ncbi:hypothetical protein [Pedosphaera parvula]|uniref:hypothetical protein n=1 Tax=Pedosphaera parvula TaxID=1032527 RepID=UPI00058E1772|nr:hypothetical protein [Pedosphaera parvula]
MKLSRLYASFIRQMQPPKPPMLRRQNQYATKHHSGILMALPFGSDLLRQLFGRNIRAPDEASLRL